GVFAQDVVVEARVWAVGVGVRVAAAIDGFGVGVVEAAEVFAVDEIDAAFLSAGDEHVMADVSGNGRGDGVGDEEYAAGAHVGVDLVEAQGVGRAEIVGDLQAVAVHVFTGGRERGGRVGEIERTLVGAGIDGDLE